ncbi:MAG: ferrochelatase [Actinomycetaceae bacterium]|nr:ferrochelatase [Actinomycetaceae bacterium]
MSQAIMMCSYGGPYKTEDIIPFIRNATNGRGIPEHRLAEVGEHYKIFGGASPINARNDEIMQALAAELSRRGIDVPVVIGNRNWHPFFADTLRNLRDRGITDVVCLFTAAYECYSGCRQYRENLAAALAEIGGEDDFRFRRARAFYTTKGFVQANVQAAVAALRELPPKAHLTFVTHSIPTPMEQGSGRPGLPSYVQQHLAVCELVAAQVGDILGRDIPVDLAFCSRSGPPHAPWLEPDINDRMQELADSGVRELAVLPIGFINDHMEVVYDLDTEAKATAQRLGIEYRRAATAGTDPAFIASLADVVCEQIWADFRGEDALEPTWPTVSAGCCVPHDNYEKLPALFEDASTDAAK